MSQTIAEHNDEMYDCFSTIKGLKKVYLQPPSSEKLVYPCLIITQDTPQMLYADDIPYAAWRTFELLLIDYDMESNIPADILAINNSNFFITPNRYYVADNLCHWSYSLVFSKSII